MNPNSNRKDRSGPSRYPCMVCNQGVTIHQKALQCDNCDEWTHFKCTPLTCDEYAELATSSQDWYCGNCETEQVDNTDAISVSSDSAPPASVDTEPDVIEMNTEKSLTNGDETGAVAAVSFFICSIGQLNNYIKITLYDSPSTAAL